MSDNKEREAFEAWRNDCGYGAEPYASVLWLAWQARASLSHAAHGVGGMPDEAVHYVLRQYFDGVTAEKASDIAHDLRIGLGAAPAPVAAPASNDQAEFMRDAAMRTVQAMGLHYTPGATRWRPMFDAPASGEAVATPIYQLQRPDGSWIDQTEHSYRYNQQHYADKTRIVYSAPIAAQEQARGMVATSIETLRKGFKTTRVCGPDDLYEISIKFRSIEDLHAADDELRALMLAAIAKRPLAESLQGDTAGWQQSDRGLLSRVPDSIATPPAAGPDDARDATRYRVLRDERYQLDEDDISVSDSSFQAYFGDELDAAVAAPKERAGNQGETR